MIKRQKQQKIRVLALLLCFLLVCSSACGKKTGAEGDAADDAPVLPVAFSVLRDNVTLMASNAASRLSAGEYASSCLNLVRSGLETAYKEYPSIVATLDQLRVQYDAYQIYLLTDLDDDLTSLEVIAASASAAGDPVCVWGDHHKAEYALDKAYNSKTPTADMFFRQWDTVFTWTAYAPITDSSGYVACILALEYITDDLSDYPEWNRMSDSWNGVLTPAE